MSRMNEGWTSRGKIMAVGANAQTSLKVSIEEIDDVGMVCRVKGMMGGWSEPQLRPWACVAHVILVAKVKLGAFLGAC